MPVPIVPNPQGTTEGGATPGEPLQTPPAPSSKFNELKQKKGFKSEEDLAASYEEVEKSKSKFEGIYGKAKQQLESAGYTMDEEGNIKQIGQSGNYPPQGQSSGYPPQGQSQETVYDPYTGTPITDPIALQLARMPVGQREAFIVNAMLDQREKQQGMAFQADSEVLSKPEAKGFEDDVRKVMQGLPLVSRADKKEWERALLQIKGARYDIDRKNWSQQGVDDFINKEGIQAPQGAGGTGSGVSLTPEEEGQFRWYQQNQPQMFKDRAHFKRALSNTGGR